MKAKLIIRAASVMLLVSLMVITILATRNTMAISAMDNIGTSRDFSEGWYTKDKNGYSNFVSLETLSFGGTAPSKLSIYHSLPDQTDDTQLTLVFSTSGISFNIYINDTVIAQSQAFSSETMINKDPGYGWHFVNLPRVSKNDIIRIDIYSYNNDGSEAVHEMYLGQSAMIFRRLLQNNMLRMFLCLILSLIGILYIFMHIMFNNMLKIKLDLLYIGIFIFLAALYSSLHLTLPALFAPNVEVLNSMEYMLLMILPIFLLAYITNACETKNKLLISLTFALLICNFTVQTLLNLFTDLSFHSMLFMSHIAVLFTMGVLLRTANEDRKVFELGDSTTQVKKNLLFAGLIVFFVGLAADVVNLYFTSSVDATRFFRIGLAILSILVGIINMMDASEFTKRTAVSDLLKRMAYTDQLTGLSNRTSFEAKLDELDSEKHELETVAVIVFDVNNLKKVNDCFGHQEGDLLIKSAASAISDIFLADFTSYRIGGDEFASIYSGKESSSYIEYHIERFYKRVEEKNLSMPEHLKLSIAAGVAYMSTATAESISSVFRRADRIMYDNKKEMKGLK